MEIETVSAKPHVSAQQQLETVEALISDFSWARTDPNAPEYTTFFVLKKLAIELKARMPKPAEDARRELGRLVAFTVKTGTPMGYEKDHLVGIGQFVMGNWAVIEHALEQQAAKEAQ